MAPKSRVGRSPEQALLEAAACAFVHDQPLDRRGLEVRPLDWERLLERAEAERLAPLLFTVSDGLPVPAPVRDALRVAWVSARRSYLLGAGQLSELLAAFEGRRVPVMLLKGPALAAALYRDPGMRPFTDLDLLVRSADLPRALRVLSGLGYGPLEAGDSLSHELRWRHAATFVKGKPRLGEFPVDLHWALLDYPGVTSAGAVDAQGFWDRAVKVEGWDHPAWGLCPEDLLIYLALHWGVHHAFSGLLWQLDLALLLRCLGEALDWESVVSRASRWRVSSGLYFALSAAQGLGVGAPPSVLDRLRPGTFRRAVVGWMRRRDGEALARLDYLLPLLLMDGAADPIRALAGGAFPPPGWVRSRYAQGSLLGAYLAHYGRVWRICVRTARAAFGR